MSPYAGFQYNKMLIQILTPDPAEQLKNAEKDLSDIENAIQLEKDVTLIQKPRYKVVKKLSNKKTSKAHEEPKARRPFRMSM